MSDVLTVPEVSRQLRVSRWTVYALVREQRLPAFRLRPGGRLLFSRQAVEQVLQRLAKQAVEV